MNDVQQLLSSTADYFQRSLAASPVLSAQLRTLLDNRQSPTVLRVVDEVEGWLAITVTPPHE